MKRNVFSAVLIIFVCMFVCGNVYADEITGKVISLSPVYGQPADHWLITIESHTGEQVTMRREHTSESLHEKLTSASLLLAYSNNHDVIVTYYFEVYFNEYYMTNIKLIK